MKQSQIGKCFSPNTGVGLVFEPPHHLGCVGNRPIYSISPSSSECHHWSGERAATSIRVTCGWVPTPWDVKSTVRETPATHGVWIRRGSHCRDLPKPGKIYSRWSGCAEYFGCRHLNVACLSFHATRSFPRR